MLPFSRLCRQLESAPFPRDKAEMLAAYLRDAPERDRAWALHLLLGGRTPAVVGAEALKNALLEDSRLPRWLLEECLERTGDLAETVALLGELRACGSAGDASSDLGLAGSAPTIAPSDASLATWIEDRLGPLARLVPVPRAPERSPSATPAGSDPALNLLRSCWNRLPPEASWAVHALALGRFPVRVSRRIAETALAATPLAADGPGASLDDLLALIPHASRHASSDARQMDLFST